MGQRSRWRRSCVKMGKLRSRDRFVLMATNRCVALETRALRPGRDEEEHPVTAIITEADIIGLLADPKPVTKRYRSVMAPRARKERPNELGRRLNVTRISGKKF
jgi:hypothetical protein